MEVTRDYPVNFAMSIWSRASRIFRFGVHCQSIEQVTLKVVTCILLHIKVRFARMAVRTCRCILKMSKVLSRDNALVG
jgi:hypothetical protein